LGIQDIQVVEVGLADLRLLQEIAKRTFYDSFAAMNTAENMQLYANEYLTDEKLRAEILNPDSRFFFARREEKPVGYIKINQGGAQTVLSNYQALEIERIYVDQSNKSNGIGKMFISKAVELASSFRANYLWLGVWEHNKPAIRFYEKNGFKLFGSHLFKLGEDEQTDLLMKRDL
jgi:diamine N-acetyltransferase